MNIISGPFDPANDPSTAPAYAKRMTQLTAPPPPASSSLNVVEPPSFPPLRPLPERRATSVRPYREEMLPRALRPWISDVAERGQFHFDFLAVSVMAALGSVIGRRCAVYPKQRDDWHEFPNLWAAIIGRPGAMKSPALGEVLTPLRRIEARWRDEFRCEEQAYKERTLRAKIERDAMMTHARKAARQGNSFDLPGEDTDIPPPICRRLLTSDPTEAKLGELLSENPQGLTLELDELATLHALFEREPSLREFLLKAWSGRAPHTIDRIGRGTIHIPAVSLSVIGGIQPGRIAPMVKAAHEGKGGDGLLQRFQLVAWPDGWEKEWSNVDRRPDYQALNQACELFSIFAERKPEDFPVCSDYGPHGLRFTREAQECFDAWHGQLQRKLRTASLSETMEAARSKEGKLVAGMALLCELADDPSATQISASSLERALEWAAVAENHWRRLYGCAQEVDVEAVHLVWAKIKAGKLREGFTAREVKRCQWKGLTEAEVVDAALATLVECGWIMPERIHTGGSGRPSCRFLINPAALAAI